MRCSCCSRSRWRGCLSGQSEDDAYAPPPHPSAAAPQELVEAVAQMDAESDVIEPLPFDAVRTVAPLEEVELVPIVEAPAVPVAAAPRCSYCGGSLPAGRAVHFCPHCGQSQMVGSVSQVQGGSGVRLAALRQLWHGAQL